MVPDPLPLPEGLPPDPRPYPGERRGRGPGRGGALAGERGLDRLHAGALRAEPSRLLGRRGGRPLRGSLLRGGPRRGDPRRRLRRRGPLARRAAAAAAGTARGAGPAVRAGGRPTRPRRTAPGGVRVKAPSGAPRAALLVVALVLAGAARGQEPGVLRWGGDAEGGAPFVEADPSDPEKLRGFDVEIAEAVAARLGRKARFVQVAFASIDASVARGDFEIGLSGVEETPARRAALSVTVPYYEFREVLTVRSADRDRFRSLADLKGRRVGTLGGTIAYDLLLQAAAEHGLEPVSYDDDVHPYDDLLSGRIDAVLLDHVIAARATRRRSGLQTQETAVATGRYVGVLAKGNAALRDEVDRALRELMKDGTLEATFRRWGVWDEGQRALFARVLSGEGAGSAATPSHHVQPTLLASTVKYLPAL
ncbi:amino acid ABC transporter substrate-binding protein, partial [Acidobacteria bacterium ACD]|nr:amino acid ABC transporter substrate-binding protein [Acidobacteria bacterium ACD]